MHRNQPDWSGNHIGSTHRPRRPMECAKVKTINELEFKIIIAFVNCIYSDFKVLRYNLYIYKCVCGCVRIQFKIKICIARKKCVPQI